MANVILNYNFNFLCIGSQVLSPIRERLRPVYIFDLNCTGEEDTIWECPLNGVLTHNCHYYYDDASLICEGECYSCN